MLMIPRFSKKKYICIRVCVFLCELCFYVSYVGLNVNCVSVRIQKGGLSPPILLVCRRL